jgi:hypothetical protein
MARARRLETELTGLLQVGEMADGSGSERSPAAAGRRRRPQLAEIVQEVTGGREYGHHLLILASPQRPDADAVEAVLGRWEAPISISIAFLLFAQSVPNFWWT